MGGIGTYDGRRRPRAGALAALAVLGSASVLAGVAAPGGSAWAVGCTAGTRSDINGDGWADAVVAAPGDRVGAGAIHVIYGSATGLHASAVCWEGLNAAMVRFL